LKKIHTERGIWLTLVSTIGMGTTAFLFGVGSREISPLMINWFTSLFLSLVSLGFLAYKSKFKEIAGDFKQNKKLILSISILENTAWITYAYSMVYIPIAISTGISQSYIVMSALLGLFINKEKLQKHQWAGLVICILAAGSLAFLTEK
jgi:drug/metabolite transporter (DMT)-like permease